jgi:hypothetical protein
MQLPPLFSLIIFTAVGGLLGATASEPSVVGSWSEAVKGLRGRLLLAPGDTVNGAGTAVVYLELQNASDVLSPMEIYFDPGRALRCEVLDTSGKPIARAGLPADIMTPLPYWIVLPHDSTLRLRVSVSGYGVPKDAGLLIGMPSGDWLIPPGSRDELFLSVSFASSQAGSADHVHPWTGVLQVPKLKVSTSQALAPGLEGKLTPEQVDRIRSARYCGITGSSKNRSQSQAQIPFCRSPPLERGLRASLRWPM